MFEIVARRVEPSGAMEKCQRSADDVGNDPVGYTLVVANELNLRYPKVRIDNAVGMRDSHAGNSWTARLADGRCAGLCAR